MTGMRGSWVLSAALCFVLQGSAWPPGVEPLASLADALSQSPQDAKTNEVAVLKLIQQLSTLPESQLNPSEDPTRSLLASIRSLDAPTYSNLRDLLGKAENRKPLNPGARVLAADLLSTTTTSFTLCGNLYLSGLKTLNPALRAKARERLIGFLQPAHFPTLIDYLNVPGANIAAYEVLQESTGQPLGATSGPWKQWLKGIPKPDTVGHLIAAIRPKLPDLPVLNYREVFYTPDVIDSTALPPDKRSAKERAFLASWNNQATARMDPYLQGLLSARLEIEKVVHQPDARVNEFLETLVDDPGLGDMASVLLARRNGTDSLLAIQKAYLTKPTPGRAAARLKLGDRAALSDLVSLFSSSPLAYDIMNEDLRKTAGQLQRMGVLPAEAAFEQMNGRSFQVVAATTRKEKQKSLKKIQAWLKRQPTSSISHT